METGQINFIYIDLPKSSYHFTLRVTFWQALFSFFSVLFLSIDTAINDVIEKIIEKISHNLQRNFEKMIAGIGSVLCPQVACA